MRQPSAATNVTSFMCLLVKQRRLPHTEQNFTPPNRVSRNRPKSKFRDQAPILQLRFFLVPTHLVRQTFPGKKRKEKKITPSSILVQIGICGGESSPPYGYNLTLFVSLIILLTSNQRRIISPRDYNLTLYISLITFCSHHHTLPSLEAKRALLLSWRSSTTTGMPNSLCCENLL